MGPGLIVMLADTDAGSIITAAQSGALQGYRLLGLQIALIPVLFLVQELTVRLGVVTGRGHGELIREHFGGGWAWVALASLLVACLGALVTELSGIAGVGLLFGVPVWLSVGAAALVLCVIVWTGSYHSVERIALLFGAFELAFVLVAWRARPSMSAITAGLHAFQLNDSAWLYLAAANIGAVIMPWMVFYQQSAVVDKRLRPEDLPAARLDTAWGAIATQLIMCAALIASAATFGRWAPHTPLTSVPQIASALTAYLGSSAGTLLFALGMLGAALVAAIVVSLTAAWGLGEVLGFRRSLENHPREAPWFYGAYTGVLLLGAALVSSGVNLVGLSLSVEVMNAALLPIVLGFLFMLAHTALPAPYRLGRGHTVLVGVALAVTIGFSLYALFAGLIPVITRLFH
jgi:Mn2+/Fe2+ NRAMP family transporter